MLDTINRDILDLYSKVLEDTIRLYRLKTTNIRDGVRDMTESYKPHHDQWKTMKKKEVQVNYDNASHRCAYLHKYAAFHTSLVVEMLGKSLMTNRNVLAGLVSNLNELKLCSLGGGPGSDAVALLYVLTSAFGVRRCSVSVVDCMIGWKQTFDSLIRKLRTGCCGIPLSQAVSPPYFTSHYIECDLLGTMQNDVINTIATANLVTMVKFLSAAACQDSHAMVREILITMKAGALLLFIDNAAGGFYQLVAKLANELQFQSVFGPLRHETYENELFSQLRWGYTSLSKTIVAVEIWQKPLSPYRSVSISRPLQNGYTQQSNKQIPRNPNPSNLSNIYSLPASEHRRGAVETPSYKITNWEPVGGTSSSRGVPSAWDRSISSPKPVAKIAAVASKPNNSAGSDRNKVSQSSRNSSLGRSYSSATPVYQRAPTSPEPNDLNRVENDNCCLCCTIS